MTMNSAAHPKTFSAKLSGYFRAVNKYPRLEHDREMALAVRWQEDQDRTAIAELINCHLGYVVKIASEFKGFGAPFEELIAAGNLGLVKAASRFDPDKGIRLSAYAKFWIRAAIMEYVSRSKSVVRLITKTSHKKLVFNLGKVKRQLRIIDQGELSLEQIADIADKLEVPAEDVVTINRRLAAEDFSLNEPLHEGQDGEHLDSLEDDTPNPEDRYLAANELSYQRSLLQKGLNKLGEREREILMARRISENQETLKSLGETFGVSIERIRQIENEAYAKLQDIVRKEFRDDKISAISG